MRERNAGAALFALCLCLYWPTSYGGVRSPDCEVVFRTAESLALHGTLAVQPLEDWPAFGTAPGRDGRRYSKFGPLPSLAMVPGVWLGAALEPTGWPDLLGDRLPLSHFAGGGLRHLLKGTRPADLSPHAIRFAASWTNPLIAALGVLVFWRLARRLARDPVHALAAALLYAFATPLWAYAGTFFSEPLAILFVLLALERLVPKEGTVAARTAPLAAGFLEGVACASHITAVLFLPPLLAYAFLMGRNDGQRWKAAVRPLALFAAGSGAVLALLGGFNWVRFGNPFVGGRTTTPDHFFMPWSAQFWSNMHGLLASGGKGLLWYCPVLILAFFAWRAFRRRRPLLADTLAAGALLRVVFIASYKDWHGGICLGPRYLLMLVPLGLLALPSWIEEGKPRRLRGAATIGALCVVQQAFFTLGEPFVYYHQLKAEFLGRGIMPADSQVFSGWEWSPVVHLLDGPRGPWVLQGMPVGDGWLVLAVSGITLGAIVLIYRKVWAADQ